MNKIITTVLAHDKLKHFFIGFFVFMGFSVIFGNLAALILTTAIGIGYELYQKKYKQGTLEVLDAVFTSLSGIIICICSLL
jgi:hypothetical protein